jgi:hypothetical protein
VCRELLLGQPPRFALAGYAWHSHAGTVRAKRVRRSLSETKAKTDWNWLGEGGPPKPSAKAGPSERPTYTMLTSVNGKSFPLHSSGASIAIASA